MNRQDGKVVSSGRRDERLQRFIEQIQEKSKAGVLCHQEAPPWLTGRWRSWSTPCCWAEERQERLEVQP